MPETFRLTLRLPFLQVRNNECAQFHLVPPAGCPRHLDSLLCTLLVTDADQASGPRWCKRTVRLRASDTQRSENCSCDQREVL